MPTIDTVQLVLQTRDKENGR